LSADRILPWLERERISILHSVPALAQSWLARGGPAVSLRAMRWMFISGEPLTATFVQRWRELFSPSGRIVNLYGTTETTMAQCFQTVPDQDLLPIQPAGWSLPETQALVLTKTSQLCGIGELGEIVLRTPFRSLGYINAPFENQQRFVKNPFLDDPQD